jgi:hypothetical protein
MGDLSFLMDTQRAGTLCMSGRAEDGYALYVKIVDRLLSTKKFTSTKVLQPAGVSLSFVFSNALHALTACIAHEELRDSSTLVAALERALEPCAAAKHYDGLVLVNFGLGLGAWLSRDRERAAEYYVQGVAAGKAAAAAKAPLCDYAKDKFEGCAGNLRVLRGEAKSEPSSPMNMNATRVFYGDEYKKIAPSLCGACGKDFAANKCGRCGERYCDAVCQRAAWPAHKHVCVEKPQGP